MKTSLPAELRPEQVVAIIDTREQLPLDLAPLATALATRKKLYLKLHPETAHGGDRKSSGRIPPLEPTPSFAEDTAEKTGDRKSERQNCRSDFEPTETAHGGDRKSSGEILPLDPTPSFAEDTATKAGCSPRTVRDDVAIGEHLDGKAIDAIAGTPSANNKSELKAQPERLRTILTASCPRGIKHRPEAFGRNRRNVAGSVSIVVTIPVLNTTGRPRNGRRHTAVQHQEKTLVVRLPQVILVKPAMPPVRPSASGIRQRRQRRQRRCSRPTSLPARRLADSTAYRLNILIVLGRGSVGTARVKRAYKSGKAH